MSRSLVAKLFDGPIDIIGDVHGEIVALRQLVRDLGYDEKGSHPHGRRLVFVGDLGDRGPDSPSVVQWVHDLLLRDRAQCVLGNHDFNALWAADGGPMRSELSWLFAEAKPFHHHGHRVHQSLVRGRRSDEILSFFASLPIALEREGALPVRVVHACWAPAAIEQLRREHDIVVYHRRERQRIEQLIQARAIEDDLERKLLHQNDNPVKCVTSGLEGRAVEPIMIHNEPRWEKRMAWWPHYREQPLVVFGHYWRTALPGEGPEYHLFDGVGRNELCGGPTMCVDYSVGKRYKERLQPGFDGSYRTSLAALRLPEGVLFFDNQAPMELVDAEGRRIFSGVRL